MDKVFESISAAYFQSLDGQNRVPDFYYNGREGYIIEWPELAGLCFYLEKETGTITIDKIPEMKITEV